jgi:LacI family transcriptional regulator
MVTIKQVAAHAGVSFKTVSRVVNHDSTVKDANREKVLKSIKELGYRPNRAASLTRRKKSNIYAIIADELLSVPYTFDIIRGAQEIAWKKNKELLILNVNDTQESIDRAIESLLEYRVEGVIYSAMYHRAIQVADELKKIPTILANCFPAEDNLPCVVPDEVQAGEEITTALINQGYRRIAFLNLNEDIVAAKGRKKGVIKAFKQHKLPLDDLLIESVIIKQNDGVERSTSRESAARIIDNFNRKYNKKDIYFMGFHPYNPPNEEEQEFLLDPTGDTTDLPDSKIEFSMMLIQKFSQLYEASDRLHRMGYYDKWPEDYYHEVVSSRQKQYKKLFM